MWTMIEDRTVADDVRVFETNGRTRAARGVTRAKLCKDWIKRSCSAWTITCQQVL